MGAVSYDLIFWRGRPTGAPLRVWKELYAGRSVPFVMPLVRAEVIAGFRREYGEDLRVDASEVLGRGWEFGVDDGALYIHVCCAWSMAEDAAALARLRRAGRYAGCSVFDPQTGSYREESTRLAEPARPGAAAVTDRDGRRVCGIPRLQRGGVRRAVQ